MTEEPDRQIVVCAPVAPIGGKIFNPETDATYSKYTEILCPQCGEKCWLGERGAALVADGVAEPMCMECAVVIGLTEGAMSRLTDRDP